LLSIPQQIVSAFTTTPVVPFGSLSVEPNRNEKIAFKRIYNNDTLRWLNTIIYAKKGKKGNENDKSDLIPESKPSSEVKKEIKSEPIPISAEPVSLESVPPLTQPNTPQLMRNSIKTSPAELMPRNRGKIMVSKYMPPQGEAWKEGIFPKDPPKLICIDAFDTIIQLRCEMGWYFRDILHEATDYCARLLPPEHYTEAFNKAYAEVNKECPCFGVRDGITSKEWWMKVTKKTYDYVDITEPGLREELDEWLLEDVFDVLFHDVFMTDEAWEIKSGAVEAMSFLKKWRDDDSEGPIALCVLSNYDERMHAILDELDMLDAFDFVLTSREIGSELPQRAAFQVAMARLGITDPKHCMLVTADFDNGVVGASKANWHPVYLPISGEQDIPTGADPSIIFSMLGDLFGVLHIWDKEPENRLIDTCKPVLENGISAFHEKVWDETDESDSDIISLPEDRTKSWEGPGRL